MPIHSLTLPLSILARADEVVEGAGPPSPS